VLQAVCEEQLHELRGSSLFDGQLCCKLVFKIFDEGPVTDWVISALVVVAHVMLPTCGIDAIDWLTTTITRTTIVSIELMEFFGWPKCRLIRISLEFVEYHADIYIALESLTGFGPAFAP
jgi:hypothetical protein